VHLFERNGRKITRHISYCQAEQENGIGNMGYMGFGAFLVQVFGHRKSLQD
jgi:hypothetical protein